jgi:hypothetical protein
MDFFLIITEANARQSIQHIACEPRFRKFFPQSNTTGTYSSSRQAGLNSSLLEKADYVFSVSPTNQSFSQNNFYTPKLC